MCTVLVIVSMLNFFYVPKLKTLFLSFLQQYIAKLSERTVAYINVDIAVFGKQHS